MWIGTRRQFNGLVIVGLTMLMITKNFSVNEMKCHCGCGEDSMDMDFMDIVYFMVKWSIASIPATLILGFIMFII